MQTITTDHRSRRRLLAAGLAAALTLALLSTALGGPVELLKEAAGLQDADKKGVGGILKVAKAIQTPALVAAAALVPLVLIGGGALLMIGNRQGTKMLASAVGAMMLFAAVGGIAS